MEIPAGTGWEFTFRRRFIIRKAQQFERFLTKPIDVIVQPRDFFLYGAKLLFAADDLPITSSENVLQFIYGQKDLSEWDCFVETIRGMGVETAIEAKQAAYDDYLNS